MIWRIKVRSEGQRVDFDQMLTFYKIREEKGGKILWKLYFQKLERIWKILIKNMWFFEKNWISYDLLKINNKKNPEMKISVQIMK